MNNDMDNHIIFDTRHLAHEFRTHVLDMTDHEYDLQLISNFVVEAVFTYGNTQRAIDLFEDNVEGYIKLLLIMERDRAVLRKACRIYTSMLFNALNVALRGYDLHKYRFKMLQMHHDDLIVNFTTLIT